MMYDPQATPEGPAPTPPADEQQPPPTLTPRVMLRAVAGVLAAVLVLPVGLALETATAWLLARWWGLHIPSVGALAASLAVLNSLYVIHVGVTARAVRPGVRK